MINGEAWPLMWRSTVRALSTIVIIVTENHILKEVTNRNIHNFKISNFATRPQNAKCFDVHLVYTMVRYRIKVLKGQY